MGLKESCSAQLSASSQDGKGSVLFRDGGFDLPLKPGLVFYSSQVIKQERKITSLTATSSPSSLLLWNSKWMPLIYQLLRISIIHKFGLDFFLFSLWELPLNNLCEISNIPVLPLGGVSHLCAPASCLAGSASQPMRQEYWGGRSHFVMKHSSAFGEVFTHTFPLH